MVRLRPVWMTNHPPSVLWHCWLGHQTCETSSPKWPKLCQAGLVNKPHATQQSVKEIRTTATVSVQCNPCC